MSRSEEETEEMVGDDGGGSSSFAGSNILITDNTFYSFVRQCVLSCVKMCVGLEECGNRDWFLVADISGIL